MAKGLVADIGGFYKFTVALASAPAPAPIRTLTASVLAPTRANVASIPGAPAVQVQERSLYNVRVSEITLVEPTPAINVPVYSVSNPLPLVATTVDAIPDTYAVLILGIGNAFLTWANTLADAQADIYNTLGQGINTELGAAGVAMDMWSQGASVMLGAE